MKTTTTNNENRHEQSVITVAPLSMLSVSTEKNVRRQTPRHIEALASNIKEVGLLNNLVVHPIVKRKKVAG